ncbi:MFS transporter [Paraburkholderia aspalathi]|uniref:Uncharacterized protein n=1 Tax=Paraburkholderia aspalathi TaxID=1324617 RepID=A0A1I7ERF3_9BURK|nr:MFS transporter [Paraburkholderia aspalathi]SFU26497.1 hypothetical protein SAMN05192563_10578 [Paraburkholderia aspalathi]
MPAHILVAAATADLLLGLPRSIGAGLPVATLRERIQVARQPVILMNLLATTRWATGAYTIYTYLAPFVARTTPLHGAATSCSPRALRRPSAATQWIASVRAA